MTEPVSISPPRSFCLPTHPSVLPLTPFIACPSIQLPSLYPCSPLWPLSRPVSQGSGCSKSPQETVCLAWVVAEGDSHMPGSWAGGREADTELPFQFGGGTEGRQPRLSSSQQWNLRARGRSELTFAEVCSTSQGRAADSQTWGVVCARAWAGPPH